MKEADKISFEIEALHGLLEREFELLKKQDFDAFESLQQRKHELLNYLIDSKSNEPGAPSGITQQMIIEHQELYEKLTECQNLQKRNEILINQKLTATREALNTIGHKSIKKNIDTYEHLGKTKK